MNWFGITHEGENRDTFVKQIQSRKLARYTGVVASW